MGEIYKQKQIWARNHWSFSYLGLQVFLKPTFLILGMKQWIWCGSGCVCSMVRRGLGGGVGPERSKSVPPTGKGLRPHLHCQRLEPSYFRNTINFSSFDQRFLEQVGKRKFILRNCCFIGFSWLLLPQRRFPCLNYRKLGFGVAAKEERACQRQPLMSGCFVTTVEFIHWRSLFLPAVKITYIMPCRVDKYILWAHFLFFLKKTPHLVLSQSSERRKVSTRGDSDLAKRPFSSHLCSPLSSPCRWWPVEVSLLWVVLPDSTRLSQLPVERRGSFFFFSSLSPPRAQSARGDFQHAVPATVGCSEKSRLEVVLLTVVS